MKFPLGCDLAAEGVPVRVTCGVLGFSTQAFSKWRARPCSDRDWAVAHTTNAIIDVHADDPEFGYRFITDDLFSAMGFSRAQETLRHRRARALRARLGSRGGGHHWSHDPRSSTTCLHG